MKYLQKFGKLVGALAPALMKAHLLVRVAVFRGPMASAAVYASCRRSSSKVRVTVMNGL